jgi:ribosomal protein S18 acetylase RimI-like enzyme
MPGSFVVEPLASGHDRTEFTCGVDALDRYFRHQVGQDVRRRVTACFIAREIATDRIAGYYTLAAGSVLLTELPAPVAKRLPRYPSVPVARLGRLAVANAYQGRKLGGAQLWDAIERSRRSEVSVYALVVDAKNEAAERFYRHYGSIGLASTPRTLLLPLVKKGF